MPGAHLMSPTRVGVGKPASSQRRTRWATSAAAAAVSESAPASNPPLSPLHPSPEAPLTRDPFPETPFPSFHAAALAPAWALAQAVMEVREAHGAALEGDVDKGPILLHREAAHHAGCSSVAISAAISLRAFSENWDSSRFTATGRPSSSPSSTSVPWLPYPIT